jgi:hypothetical protein
MAKAGLREASMELTLRFAHMWWAGFKVFCRWCAFGMVLWAVGLPIGGLIYLIGLIGADSTLSVVFAILITPIAFYFTSKYLDLLGDENRAVVEDNENPTESTGRRGYPLRMKIVMSAAVVYLSSFVFTPSPDPFSSLVFGTPAAFLCAVSLLILSRFNFLKSSSKSVQTLVCVLVCLVSVLAVACLLFVVPRIPGLHDWLAGSFQNAPVVHSLQ